MDPKRSASEWYEGYLIERSVLGWWVVDTEAEHGDRQWLVQGSKHDARAFILRVLIGGGV